MRIESTEQFQQLVGTEIARVALPPITQEDVNAFAGLTDDHQWIHTDPVRASDGPFGGCVVHGFLLLSHVATALRSSIQWASAEHVVNYGLERVRFPRPLLVGQPVEVKVSVADLTHRAGGRWLATYDVAFLNPEDEGGKPYCLCSALTMVDL